MTIKKSFFPPVCIFNLFFSQVTNPTTNAVTITMSEGVEADALRITDLQGRVIYSTTVSNLTINFEFNEYEQGVYLIQLMKNGVPFSASKVVVRK